MPDLNARDAKLIQYLNEAHTKERQLEQALEAHIAMTEIATYRKRLKDHLTETKRHAREVERRIKQLGGQAEGIGGVVQKAAGRVQEGAARGAALAQGQVHMLRGTGIQEKMLKNAKTEFQERGRGDRHLLGDRDAGEDRRRPETEQLAKAILREEKRMAGFLEKLIPRLAQSVVEGRDPAPPNATAARRTTSRRAQPAAAPGRAGRAPRARRPARETTLRARRLPHATTAARRRPLARNGASRSTSRAEPRLAAARSGTTRRTAASGSARRSPQVRVDRRCPGRAPPA